ncbi:MAG: PIN domain-containing protein [Desulfamplus sp.]|nr:PIN domain-containing protein [Desulfamplus sp.]
MYLFDTNIFLEILLSQDKSANCKRVLTDNIGNISISDFSLHSIGVILFRHKKEHLFTAFVKDVLPIIEILSLSKESYNQLSILKNKYQLDFDDLYQFQISQEKGLSLITMDKDFERVKGEINVIFI